MLYENRPFLVHFDQSFNDNSSELGIREEKNEVKNAFARLNNIVDIVQIGVLIVRICNIFVRDDVHLVQESAHKGIY